MSSSDINDFEISYTTHLCAQKYKLLYHSKTNSELRNRNISFPSYERLYILYILYNPRNVFSQSFMVFIFLFF
jgi:hypothetical protein